MLGRLHTPGPASCSTLSRNTVIVLTNGQAGRWLVLEVLGEFVMQHVASPDTVRALVDRNIQSCDEAVEVERFLVEDLGIATLAKCRQRHRAALEIMTIAGKWSEVHHILVKESCIKSTHHTA